MDFDARDKWKYMQVDKGEAVPFVNTKASAFKIVDLILQRGRTEALLIQQEMVDLEQILPETPAGKTLGHTLKDLPSGWRR